MNSIQIRNLEIGTGIPKICVPITGSTKEELLAELHTAKESPADLIEWRADFFEQIQDFSAVLDVLKDFRQILKEMPLLFTFRTQKEGGQKCISRNDYIALLQCVLRSGHVDLIDVELYMGKELVTELLASAHFYGITVIVSNHDFEKTPSKEELLSRLIKMQELGADLPKIAVMPQCKKDVLTLLSAAEEMTSCYADRPLIAISMSELGCISRLCGEFFGSAITFGSAGNSSAPGQINANELKNFLELFHTYLSEDSLN